jgi:hypothetical protein
MAEQVNLNPPPGEKKTYHGSCHCGFITYDIAYALPAQPTASRCNCTICLKSGFTGLMLNEADFTLKTPASVAELPDYVWRSQKVHRYYCNKCGVQIYGKGEYEFQGQKIDFFSVNLVTLDQPQEGLDLSTFKMQYISGRDDNFAIGIKDTPYAGGCI